MLSHGGIVPTWACRRELARNPGLCVVAPSHCNIVQVL
ncbi:hypothetical protein LA76x_0802 [Lysobacter antibioticus]|uniref:Uncharacterized protein n=1 Tax=Lysobacter antibioticus TaxID=84531 RepID=A0A0S2F634_LYSAN|nr:hypothetical protein LA76x_0802 [Lysobacter antibioticus]